MITVQKSAESALIIKKSKFLGLASRAETEEEALHVLEQRRKRFFDASHHCYGYALENGISRFSDDGEPSGTAGRPILEVINKSGLSDVIVICTRYFGGTLLGAGGLVRAYSQCASDSLKEAGRIEFIPCSLYRLDFSYELWAKAENMLKKAGYIIEDKIYLENVSATVCVKKGLEANFLELICNLSLGRTAPELINIKMIEM